MKNRYSRRYPAKKNAKRRHIFLIMMQKKAYPIEKSDIRKNRQKTEDKRMFLCSKMEGIVYRHLRQEKTVKIVAKSILIEKKNINSLPPSPTVFVKVKIVQPNLISVFSF